MGWLPVLACAHTARAGGSARLSMRRA
ncbi:hypothetical protein BMAJHU_J0001, partial [Burkholderia mallei JHU]